MRLEGSAVAIIFPVWPLSILRVTNPHAYHPLLVISGGRDWTFRVGTEQGEFSRYDHCSTTVLLQATSLSRGASSGLPLLYESRDTASYEPAVKGAKYVAGWAGCVRGQLAVRNVYDAPRANSGCAPEYPNRSCKALVDVQLSLRVFLQPACFAWSMPCCCQVGCTQPHFLSNIEAWVHVRMPRHPPLDTVPARMHSSNHFHLD